MCFTKKESVTVISVIITIHNKSCAIDKTPNECNKKELINETFRQLKETFPNLPHPTYALVEQNTYLNGKNQMIMDL